MRPHTRIQISPRSPILAATALAVFGTIGCGDAQSDGLPHFVGFDEPASVDVATSIEGTAVQQSALTATDYTKTYTVTENGTKVLEAKLISREASRYKRPVVFVEGFDILKDNTIAKIEKDFFDDTNLKTELLDGGFTLVIVDLVDNHAELKTNGLRLGNVIEQIWRDCQQLEPVKLVGVSMGGLVSTYASHAVSYTRLLNSKGQNLTVPAWTFPVNLVLAVDSPHQGAYVPKALFNFTNRFADHNASAKTFSAAMKSNAARQMLLMPYDDAMKKTRDDWQRFYTDMIWDLRRATSTRLVSLVAGSWTGQVQSPSYVAGRENITWRYETSTAISKANLYVQGRSDGKVAHLSVNYKFGGGDYKDQWEAPGTWPLFENASGGYLSGWKMLADTLPGSITAGQPFYPNHTFVPAFSAAGVSYDVYITRPASSRDSMQALESAYGRRLEDTGLTPFHAIYHFGDGQNRRHADLQAYAEMRNWIKQELVASVKYAPIPWCEGSAGGWAGCRGNGCAVCTELSGSYPNYFKNRPQCEPNTTCAGQHYTCNAACTAPTAADQCNGTSGQWAGCRGTGCAVCNELVRDYPRYFIRHPNCLANSTCAGQYYTCSAACPQPTAEDR
jgi:hypothetical protein